MNFTGISGATAPQLLLDAALRLRQDLRRCAQHLGLTRSQIAALACLSMQPGLAQVELAEDVEVHPVTITQIIGRLQKDAWVRREVDEDDRRVFHVFVTRKAQPLLEGFWAIVGDRGEQALEGFTASERVLLAQFLRRIQSNITARGHG
ncbi:MarR family winged helix-turn-helix transcriptional regulator [Solimonas soli]|uniref:MarR family winged helix-turn-helix transcriptional regulator n=1 Tax=Solimonas soli TaxID=413479 RepID=UPI0004AD28DD|nr:MarR family transcriptional regulator [Solimonas soli]